MVYDNAFSDEELIENFEKAKEVALALVTQANDKATSAATPRIIPEIVPTSSEIMNTLVIMSPTTLITTIPDEIGLDIDMQTPAIITMPTELIRRIYYRHQGASSIIKLITLICKLKYYPSKLEHFIYYPLTFCGINMESENVIIKEIYAPSSLTLNCS